MVLTGISRLFLSCFVCLFMVVLLCYEHDSWSKFGRAICGMSSEQKLRASHD